MGFRPFVYRLATEWGLSGSVRNDAGGVIIEAQGHEAALDGFAADLVRRRPALAVIDQMSATALTVNEAESAFQIADSDRSAQASAEVTVDTALCPDCLGELLGQTDRRAGYGLINCTNCGPRYSIIRRVPYDRPNTTMAGFHMCPACADEYSNPADRRFHAQPIACHDCGPKVSLVDCRGWPMAGDPIVQAARLLGEGRIVAIKGLGGFHLAVRADDEAAVARLRRLKQRNAKPFAIMCRDLAAARELVELSDAAVDAMLSPACPIVLARRRAGVRIAESVAPDNHRLGVMLPYTPIQHLLFAAMGGLRVQGSGFSDEGAGAMSNDEARSSKPESMTKDEGPMPKGTMATGTFLAGNWQPATASSCPIENRKSKIENPLHSALSTQHSALVMTSANLSDEPLVIDNNEALVRLGGICDAILWHDRPIERPVDDSVLLDMPGQPPLPIRRARGYVPGAIRLPVETESQGLCVGGELKNTVAVVRASRAVLSHHLGEMTHPAAYEGFRKAIDDLCDLFSVKPAWIAHDLHPAYVSTQYARGLAGRLGVPLVGVQHHHAHAAAVMAEHGQSGPVLAIVCDGVGYGPDGTAWGGELLATDLLEYQRIGHLRPMRLPGGDAAARDTRRCALALLQQALGERFDEHPAAARIVPDAEERAFFAGMLRRGTGCITSTGAGRLFDGVAGLLGVCRQNSFEAEAAMRLESLASACERAPGGADLFEITGTEPFQIDFSRLVLDLLLRMQEGAPTAELAALFHAQFARAWARAALEAAGRLNLKTIAISGGVFCNQIVTELLSRDLEARGLLVLRHRVVPPNDGGLALGQAAVAAARVARGLVESRGA